MMLASLALAVTAMPFRPPSVPLVTHTPYFSAWSNSDRLTDDWPKHWTGGNLGMCGLIKVDGKPLRFLGPFPQGVPAMEQKSVRVTATRSIYRFEGEGVGLDVEFCSPLLTDNLEVLSRPVTYLTLKAESLDGKQRKVEAYVDWSGEWVVNESSQKILAGRHRLGGLDVLSMRSLAQPVLERAGDRVRIDWGALYLVGPGSGQIAPHNASREGFVTGKPAPDDDLNFPRPAYDDWPVVAYRLPLGPSSQTLLIAYDEQQSVEYFQRKLRPYWNRQGRGLSDMLCEALSDVNEVRQRCAEFDAKIEKELTELGGPEYAHVGALAFRQCIAGHGLVEDLDGDLLMFSKENTSNGCIGTVDVTFPASPFFLHFNPDLLKAQVRPILEYASMPRWRFPFAPHDLGTYPQANGQVYGGGESSEENQMPVEESANMLLMLTALARKDSNTSFVDPYWGVVTKWANYLLAEGLDPDSQLCTDDFTGHLAHNTNLSLKAILALRGYAELCERRKDKAGAAKFKKTSEDWAKEWMRMADDGDHYRLAFDKPGTWSQKYNLYWDKLLGYNLFPAEVARKELAHYQKQMGPYGFPLDNRATFTKTDWIYWSASLAETKEQFMALTTPVNKMLAETESRVPFTDWYKTDNGRAEPFQARTVIGGVFARAALGRLAK